jgi:uncharacterized protein YidB (DUF937 family)
VINEKGDVAMGFLDELVKTVTGKFFGGSSQGGLMEQVIGLINNPETGGLAGLVETFKNKGLGDAVSSWIGTGENESVSGEAIVNILGTDKIEEIAGKLGISSAEASAGIAAMLPQLIDKLTPDGTIPSGGLLEQGLINLKEKLH